MKTIENKTTSMKKSGGDEMHTYGTLITQIISGAPASGLSVGDIMTRMRITQAIDDTITLEDADYQALQDIIKAHRFGMYHEDIAMFCMDILEQQAMAEPVEALDPVGAN